MGIDERELKKLELEKEVIEKPSPLAIIKQKEIEINTRILEAQRQAEDKVAEARRKASEVRSEAEKSGIAEAKVFYKEQIAEAKKEAEKIKKTAGKEVELVNKQGLQNRNKAVRYIMETMLS